VLCACFAPWPSIVTFLSLSLFSLFLSLATGSTDAADHWRCFLLNHGGLLPRHLRGKPDALGAGAAKVRRKRK
jgi:hypothetical protein